MAAAASGTLAMSPPDGTDIAASGALDAIPNRPMTTISDARALDTVAAAGQSLTSEASETATQAHNGILEQQRRDAAEEAARAEREARRWTSPLSDYRISAGFGSSGRMWSGVHEGLDLAASHGAEVRAISSGEVIFAGWDGAYGNKIEIRHHDGTVSWYAHLSRIVVDTGPVEPGTVIGRVGSTGNSTGPHLHLEIRPNNGSPVNPRTWLAEHGLNL